MDWRIIIALIIGIAMVFIGFMFFIVYLMPPINGGGPTTTTTTTTPVTTVTTTIPVGIWGEYDQQRIAAGIGDEYLQETEYYDYSHPLVQEKVMEFKNSATTVKEATKNALGYVGGMGYCSGSGCYKCPQKASQTIEDGYGICSVRTQTLIAILRGMGVAARGVVGIKSTKTECIPLAMILPTPLRTAVPTTETGGLAGRVDHAWVEAWLPEYGWVTLDSVSPLMVQNCINFEKWGNCGDGYYYNFEELGHNDACLSNKCWSQVLWEYVDCKEWTKECCWVPDSACW